MTRRLHNSGAHHVANLDLELRVRVGLHCQAVGTYYDAPVMIWIVR